MYDATKRSSFYAISRWTQCIIIWKESDKQIRTDTWKWYDRASRSKVLNKRQRIPHQFQCCQQAGQSIDDQTKKGVGDIRCWREIRMERCKERDIWNSEWNRRRSFVDWWWLIEVVCYERNLFRVCWAKQEGEAARLSVGKFLSLRALCLTMGFDISIVCYSCSFILEFLGQPNCHRLWAFLYILYM